MDNSDIEFMKHQIEDYEANRDLLITKSRVIVKLSKRIIYSVHRDDMASAEKFVADISREKQAIEAIAQNDPALPCEGSFKMAMQEYVEALVYFLYVKEERIPPHKMLAVSPKMYILGICDVTGELGRRAVRAATKGNYSEVVKIKDVVEEIFGDLLGFDFRDNETRRKFDSIKYDLKKLEDLVLDLKLKGKI